MAKIISVEEAAKLIPSGSTVMFGGFVGCGAALKTIDALSKNADVQNITGIFNDSSKQNGPDGEAEYAWAKLIHTGQLTGYIGSHLGTNAEASAKWAEGSLKVELVPQGSLAEMIRAGGCGLGGVITPTGVGTLVEDSPYVQDKVNYNGVDYLVMKPLHADVALLGGTKVDKFGNVWFKGTTSNFQTVMAMAADKVIVEAEELVEIGDIEPENVRIPGILVDYIVVKEG
jgi:acetate CoA/acetoacetate CoA-transferase alpha subunit